MAYMCTLIFGYMNISLIKLWGLNVVKNGAQMDIIIYSISICLKLHLEIFDDMRAIIARTIFEYVYV